ncbi:MAG: alpha-amylase C-terminal beta-sheet domain-containing protein [Bacteroidota bacterium]
MRRLLLLVPLALALAACDTDPVPEAAPAPPASAFTGDRSDVLLQGFHWRSHQHDWWDIVRANAGAIDDAGFTMVWLPPPSRSAAAEGYLPNEWRNLDASAYGTEAELKAAIDALRSRGVRAIADIVVNHRVGTTDWADFSRPAFSNNARAVTRGDEWGQGTGNPDTGDGYDAARDLDHQYGSVQREIKSWQAWLQRDIGFDGWRYDYVKGFHGWHVGDYNAASQPYFSVGELWPDITGNYYASCSGANYHRQRLMDWINQTGARSAAFDFTTKWQLMLAVQRNEYWRMGCVPGAIGWWPEMSVTFVDNHDTGPSPGGGQDHWPFPANRLEVGYAYILTHPGTPTVYWPHYFDCGSDLRGTIRSLVQIRQQQGITSTSSIQVRVAEAGRYAAEINGNTVVKIGPWDWSPGGGWTLASYGTQWAVWTR